MFHFVLVGLGGFLGTLLRYFISYTSPPLEKFTFLPVLLVNLTGSALIGGIIASPLNRLYPNLFLFLVPGLLGGFTTFSTFSAESFMLLNEGQYKLFFIYLLASVLGGLLICALAYMCLKKVF